MNELEFENWCLSQRGKSLERVLNFNEYRQSKPWTKEEIEANFLTEIKSTIENDKETSHISIGSGDASFSDFRYDFSSLEPPHKLMSRSSAHIGRLEISTPQYTELSSGAIGRVDVFNSSKKIHIHDCFIAHLSVVSAFGKDLTLRNCWIGLLELGSNSIGSLDVKGGSIRSIISPPPDGDNPFTGSVLISRDVLLPVSTKWPLFPGPQPYRNLRVHLEKLQNVPAANLFRSRELRAERADEYGINWLINWMYGTFSDYGSRPGLALWLAFGIYLITAFVILKVDGGALGHTTESYVGWRSSLTSEVWRSFALPLQSLINPLGLFGSRNLVIAATGWGKFILAIQGLFCDALVLMAILGIRRRFRQR